MKLLGLYFRRRWKGFLGAIVFWSLVILLLFEWSDFLRIGSSVVSGGRAGWIAFVGALPTTLGANYLLSILIVATIGVASIPYLRGRWNRPKLGFHGVFYPSSRIRYNGSAANTPTKGIYFVLVELWNSGRGPAHRPVFGVQIFEERVPRIAELSGNLESDIVVLNSIPLPVNTTTYDYVGNDELASQFFQKGIQTFDYLAGNQSGKKVILGIAFEDGNKFYIPSKESIEPQSFPIGDGRERYLWAFTEARNAKKKIVAKNIKLTLPKWNQVKLDYRSRESDAALAKEIERVWLEPRGRTLLGKKKGESSDVQQG